MGAKGYYEDDRSWATRAIYFPNNIPGGVITEDIKRQMRRSLTGGGTLVPDNITFEQVNDSQSNPVSGSAIIDIEPDGTTKISGDVKIWVT